MRAPLLATLVLTALTGCEANIIAPTPGPHLDDPASPDPVYLSTDPEGDPNRVPELPFSAAPSSLRLLTTRQYQNSVSDLIGSGFNVAPLGGFEGSLAAAQSGLSPQLVEEYEDGAFLIAQQVFANSSRRAQLVGCDPASSGCIDTYVRTIGRRVFRRTLTTEELTRLRGVATTSAQAYKDPWKGAEMAFAAMLQSPHFLYRVELGVAFNGQSDLVYTDEELASRISFALWNSAPDETLLTSAENGSLADPARVKLEARRLLASPNASRGIEQFLIDWLNIDEIARTEKDSVLFPQFTPALAAAMREELVRTISDQFLRSGSNALDLYESRDTFVNGPLAALYDMSGVTGTAMQKVRLPDTQHRGGVLGMAGLLSIQASSVATSPVHRGHLLRLMMMCQTITPPKGLVLSLPPFDPTQPTTNRERLESHRSNAVCAGCHAQFDPIGLGLERFDAIGGYRTKEAGKDIDVTGELDGIAFTDELGLNAAVRGNVRTPGCFVRQVYRYVHGHVESPNEEVTLYELKHGFASNGYQFGPLLEDIVSHPTFRLATASP